MHSYVDARYLGRKLPEVRRSRAARKIWSGLHGAPEHPFHICMLRMLVPYTCLIYPVSTSAICKLLRGKGQRARQSTVKQSDTQHCP